MSNLFKQETLVSQSNRIELLGQEPKVLWFTGLSGSGKSTLADALQLELFKRKKLTYMLDGDNIRMGLNQDLTFSDDDRIENIRRIAEVSKLFLDAGVYTLCSFISPFHSERQKAKSIIGASNFIEIFVNASLDVCESRDVKGLYKRARTGEIKKFTGIDSPYEAPINPDIEINTSETTISDGVNKILTYLEV
jgi:adenylyl-sulfate kinase